MAIPLIWLGAAAAATYVGLKHGHKISQSRGIVDSFPGDSEVPVAPKNGAVVCCEVYSVLDHTGIWVDGSIVELNGNGLVRAISPERFLAERSGEHIFIACDEYDEPLITHNTHERAISHVYQYRDYDLLKNNCHRFVWEMVTGNESYAVDSMTRFTDLNQNLSRLHDSVISWHLLDLPDTF